LIITTRRVKRDSRKRKRRFLRASLLRMQSKKRNKRKSKRSPTVRRVTSEADVEAVEAEVVIALEETTAVETVDIREVVAAMSETEEDTKTMRTRFTTAVVMRGPAIRPPRPRDLPTRRRTWPSMTITIPRSEHHQTDRN